MHNSHRHLIWAIALALALGAGAAHAESQKKAARSAARPKVLEAPSHETQAQRDRRLERECKGRPNAGACLGYAN